MERRGPPISDVRNTSHKIQEARAVTSLRDHRTAKRVYQLIHIDDAMLLEHVPPRLSRGIPPER
jgi:hypothetical protein